MLREGQFQTLLQNAADAQDFSDTVLEQQGKVRQLVTVTTKMQSIEVEVGDFINVQLDRPVNEALGFAYCNVLGIDRNLSSFEIDLELEILDFIDDPGDVPLVTAEDYYEAPSEDGDTFYDDGFYGGLAG